MLFIFSGEILKSSMDHDNILLFNDGAGEQSQSYEYTAAVECIHILLILLPYNHGMESVTKNSW